MDTDKQPAESATPRAASSAWQGVPLALGLGLALLLLSFVRVLGNTQTMLFHTDVLDSVFANRIIGTTLARNVALFVAALLLLHFAYGLLCLGLARVSAVAWPSDRARLPHRILLAFLVLTAWLLASNAQHFPRTLLGNPYASAMRVSWLGFGPATWIGFAITLAIAVMGVTAAARWWRGGSAESRLRASVVPTAIVAVIATAFAIPEGTARPQAGASPKPNIILIGIDSLRSDLVAQSTSPHVMPKLEAFLAQSASFSDATTPLARTFPSWVSILTGRDPHDTGAVVNLLPRDTVHEGTTLGAMLHEAGYATAYAIDDVRFSNIDETYGFDRTVTPPIGASEFLIGFFADTPLSNLVLNTPVGRVLFPFTSGNRSVAETYDPDTFIHRIATEVDYREPLFLAAHLTLPHWPYTWADAPPSRSDPGDVQGERWPDYYLFAARRADQQFGDLLEVLRKRGALDNAIVVVFSDHGETFGWASDSVVPVDGSEIVHLEAVPTWGHGTSVFTPEQYHTVLAVRSFGATPLGTNHRGVIDAPVSVEDITPTVADVLALGGHGPFDGRSLLPLVRGEPGAADTFSGRIRLTETEFNPPDIATQGGKVSPAALAQAATNYQIDPVTDRISLRREMVQRVVRQRQFAAFGKESLMAAVPLPDGTAYRYLLVDQRTGKFETLTGAPGESSPAEARTLWMRLHEKYGSILDAAPSPRLANAKMLTAPSALTERVQE